MQPGEAILLRDCFIIRLACSGEVADFPLSVRVDTFGTGKVSEEAIEAAIDSVFDLTPRGIVTALDLLKPGYERTAYNGHFGRPEFSWEDTSKASALTEAVGAAAS